MEKKNKMKIQNIIITGLWVFIGLFNLIYSVFNPLFAIYTVSLYTVGIILFIYFIYRYDKLTDKLNKEKISEYANGYSKAIKDCVKLKFITKPDIKRLIAGNKRRKIKNDV